MCLQTFLTEKLDSSSCLTLHIYTYTPAIMTKGLFTCHPTKTVTFETSYRPASWKLCEWISGLCIVCAHV